jgi:hypothetical protein
MMKFGMRTGRARTPDGSASSLGEKSGEQLTLPVRERERWRSSRPEDFLLTGAQEAYRPRHAADVVEESMDGSEPPADHAPGRPLV